MKKVCTIGKLGHVHMLKLPGPQRSIVQGWLDDPKRECGMLTRCGAHPLPVCSMERQKRIKYGHASSTMHVGVLKAHHQGG
jgi:hypothetical protein